MQMCEISGSELNLLATGFIGLRQTGVVEIAGGEFDPRPAPGGPGDPRGRQCARGVDETLMGLQTPADLTRK